MKTTKKHIRENIRTTEVKSMTLGRLFNHWYQHAPNEAFELHHSHPVVMHHVGPNSYEIGGATTKTEFIEVVYNFFNS